MKDSKLKRYKYWCLITKKINKGKVILIPAQRVHPNVLTSAIQWIETIHSIQFRRKTNQKKNARGEQIKRTLSADIECESVLPSTLRLSYRVACVHIGCRADWVVLLLLFGLVIFTIWYVRPVIYAHRTSYHFVHAIVIAVAFYWFIFGFLYFWLPHHSLSEMTMRADNTNYLYLSLSLHVAHEWTRMQSHSDIPTEYDCFSVNQLTSTIFFLIQFSFVVRHMDTAMDRLEHLSDMFLFECRHFE